MQLNVKNIHNEIHDYPDNGTRLTAETSVSNNFTNYKNSPNINLAVNDTDINIRSNYKKTQSLKKTGLGLKASLIGNR